MTNDTATLNDLIEVLTDGQTFYKDASESVKRPDLKALFARMALNKAAVAADLEKNVVAKGSTPASGGTFFGAILKSYGELRTKVSSDSNYEYIAQLEGFEDRILHGFRDAVENSDDEAVRAIAKQHLPEVLRDHNEMRDLKHASKAA